MVGIYHDSFVNFLRDHLGDPVKITSKNIIVRCPFCEMNSTKKHFHMYISLESPVFHCFFSECHQKGFISKLIKKIEGKDITDKFISEEKIKEFEKIEFKETHKKEIKIPQLNEDKFKLKTQYLKGRLRYSDVDLSTIKGLFFDVDEFIDLNHIKLDSKMERLKPYLQSSFIGFCAEHGTVAVMRNIDKQSEFKHFKFRVQEEGKFSDYYKIQGNNYKSNKIVLSEGIFDVLLESVFDSTGLKNEAKLYAAGLHTFYESLVKSIVYHEQIFKPEVHIISDRDVSLKYYNGIKKYRLDFLLDKLVIYYNKSGKDFADVPVNLETFIL